MAQELRRGRLRLNWRAIAALALFTMALVGLTSGVQLTERPDVGESSLLTKAYYSLGLFVLGGLDLGIPVGGSWWGRGLLWIAYFGAPILTASALVNAIVAAVAPERWRLRRLRDHIVIGGAGPLTGYFLRTLRLRDPSAPVVVVHRGDDFVREQELERRFHATVVRGDLSQSFLMRQLGLHRARRVVLLGDDDFQSLETAARIVQRYPEIKGELLVRIHSLRFMRSMAGSALAQDCTLFNTYELAAEALVQHELMPHFERTESLDVVVMAGFGRFGQTIIERLQRDAAPYVDKLCIVDRDANRRVLVVEEQQQLGSQTERRVFQGDISHPDVWRQLESTVDLEADQPTIILGTGAEQHNLRTAIWIKQRFPNARVYSRTLDRSLFAEQMCREHGIEAISITALLERHMPGEWFASTAQPRQAPPV